MRRKLPNTRTLIAFEAAARRESFSRAASDLSLTQGAISRQVQSLEQFLNATLFHRTGGRIVLNRHGERLLMEIAPLLDSLETTITRLSRLGKDGDAVSIATYPTLATRWLLSRKLAFESQDGAPTLRIATIPSNAAFEPEKHQLAILQGEPPWPGLRHDLLMVEELVVAGAPQAVGTGPHDIEDVARLVDMRHVTRPISFRLWSRSAGRATPDPLGGSAFDHYDMMIETAVAGYGVGVFPLILIARELDRGLLTLAHPHVARPGAAYYLLTPDDRCGDPGVEAFRDWLLSSDLGA